MPAQTDRQRDKAPAAAVAFYELPHCTEEEEEEEEEKNYAAHVLKRSRVSKATNILHILQQSTVPRRGGRSYKGRGSNLCGFRTLSDSKL
jgi:hypothetical protein